MDDDPFGNFPGREAEGQYIERRPDLSPAHCCRCGERLVRQGPAQGGNLIEVRLQIAASLRFGQENRVLLKAP
jgi:hypothetical protein